MLNMISIAKRVFFSFKNYGIRVTAQKIASEIFKRAYDYNFILLSPPKDWVSRPLSAEKLSLNWYIPDFGIGSGGHSTIFRIIHFLTKFGHLNRIILIPPTKYTDSKKIKEIVDKYFIDTGDTEVYIWGQEIPGCDASIATSWHTAYYVNFIKDTSQKFYFVQDYEPVFYPMGSEFIFAENTYRMGFKCIAASPWLAKMLQFRYGLKSDYFELAYSPEEYYPRELIRKPRTVVFYARHVSPRRGFELGVLALKRLKEIDPDVEIIFYGWKEYPRIPFKCKKEGILGHKGLEHLYNTATVGLVISLTNYSLIPNEMMACKLPVVEVKTECMEMLYKDGEEIVLAPSEPNEIAEAILSLLSDKEKRQYIAENAHKKIKDLTWEKSAKKVEEIILKLGNL